MEKTHANELKKNNFRNFYCDGRRKREEKGDRNDCEYDSRKNGKQQEHL